MDTLDRIAIIGMAGRFPGARDVDELWRNLRGGVESITRFTEEELAANGVAPELLADPAYVRARGVLDGVELFDAEFFGFTPREAELMDPQHRLFLECAWQACENAGYDPQGFAGRVGVFGGSASTSYFAFNLLSNPSLLAEAGGLQIKLLNDKDFLTTHTSYKLNLRGPSVAVQTACSTSLVAIHIACQALLGGECDLALAGGVGVSFPHRTGYLFEEGNIGSPDGHCRAFDENARGTVEGNGAGVVLLKRLADALADGDTVHAVILGSAINNDGAAKAGYTAPSVESQTEAVAEALVVAQVEPDTIGYVEAHGSGTPLGDPIEVQALTRAFRASTDRQGFCGLGSIKTNIGHADAAAGVAGLIKTVQALKHGQIPPSLHFERPNPALGLEESPFYVSTALRDWPVGAEPRRAGVNSLGIGGTNAHIVLEEAPPPEPSSPSRPWQLLVLSARTASALDAATANLAGWLEDSERSINLADATHTLRVGRKTFRYRRALVCRDGEEAARLLRNAEPGRLITADAGTSGEEAPGVAFLFPGLGDHYAGMGAELYQREPVFREAIDRCAELLRPHLGVDIREVLYPEGAAEPPSGPPGTSAKSDLRRLLAEEKEPGDDGLGQTLVAHPAVFAVEYALAQLWMEWGIRPQALLGYSLGEYVAACLAGVFSLEDALALVAARARLIDGLPGGAMLAVPLPAAEVEPLLRLLPAELSLCAANGPALSVVGGPSAAVEELARGLAARGIASRRLQTVHAFHSRMMEPVVADLARVARGITFAPPRIPFVSNVTGTWITDAEATDPGYWARHLRETVRFAEGLEALMARADAGDRPRILLEVGPGQALGTLARQHPARPAGQVEVSSLRDRRDDVSDQAFLLDALGRLWLAGAAPDWTAFAAGESRRRVPLPTYPFERRRYFIEPGAVNAAAPGAGSRSPLDDWFYTPVWERAPALASPALEPDSPWMLFLDELGLGERVAARLEAHGHTVFRVAKGEGFSALGERSWSLDPRNREGYRSLFRELRPRGDLPGRIIHLWSLTPAVPTPAEAEELGFYSLLWLSQALGELELHTPLHVRVVANGLQEVTGGEELVPEKALLLGPCRVLPQEIAHVTCGVIDVLPEHLDTLADRLVPVLASAEAESVAALRGRHRWVRRFCRIRLPEPGAAANRLRQGGVYLIAGGLGETGLVVAEHLVRTAGAKLALLAPEDTPPRPRWGEWLGARDEQDEEAVRLRRVLALEAEGHEVLVLPVDLTHPGRVEAAVSRVRERFGAIHGVILAEEDAPGGLMQWKTRDTAAAELAPKVRGTLALAAATRDLPLDLFVLFGAHAAAIGGFGQADVCAASSFLDALAQARSVAGGGPFTQTIDWGHFRWQPVTAADPALAEQLRAALATYGITAGELEQALERALASGLPQVVVSTQDLDALAEQLDSVHAAGFLASAHAAHPGEAHPRPDLAVDYLEPRTSTERTLAGIWQEAFGLDRVGAEDNFFDLAGNSLLAIQIITRVNAAFGSELPMAALLESPTVAELADRIEDAGFSAAKESDEEELARLLAEIESLSLEEAEVRLARELGTGGEAG